MTILDASHDPARRSWVESANLVASDFPIQNLPLGVFRRNDETSPLQWRAGMAIGEMILDLQQALQAGFFEGEARQAVEATSAGQLNALFALGRKARSALRTQAGALLDAHGEAGKRAAKHKAKLLHQMADCTMALPSDVRNYTDFYAGIHHARAAGALFMPENPLPSNYKWVPIAYHGRASSVRVSGGAIRRPSGQQAPLFAGGAPVFGPCKRLDLELELGFFIAEGNPLGAPISIAGAGDQIAGFCLLNDWSARDIQFWEMLPLGPFLGKNFSTTISAWVITPEALAPFRASAMARPEADPKPLDYLWNTSDQAHGNLDVKLAVHLSTARMRQENLPAHKIIVSNTKHLYWTPAQMVAHHTIGGCNLLPGDLIGSGTISGPTPEQLGSLLELTRGAADPIALPGGEMRTYLEDGDEIALSGRCEREGFVSIGFGTCAGRISE